MLSVRLRILAFVLIFSFQSNSVFGCKNSSLDERLTTYCIIDKVAGKVVSTDEGRHINELIKNIGLGEDLSVEEVKHNARFYILPIVQHSQNINGGNSSDKLVINGLEFTGDPQLSKKAGMLVGVGLGVYGRKNFNGGYYFKYNSGLNILRSPEHDLNVFNHNISGCFVKHLKNWRYLDLCISSFEEEKKLSDYQERNYKIQLSNINKIDNDIYIRPSVALNNFHLPNSSQKQLEFGIEAIVNKNTNVSNFYKFGEQINGQLSLKEKVRTMLETKVFGTEIKFVIDQTKSEGGRFLGINLREDINTKTLSFRVWKDIEIGVGNTKTRSSISSFNQNFDFVFFTLPAIRF
jgi:hypothetical protein